MYLSTLVCVYPCVTILGTKTGISRKYIGKQMHVKSKKKYVSQNFRLPFFSSGSHFFSNLKIEKPKLEHFPNRKSEKKKKMKHEYFENEKSRTFKKLKTATLIIENFEI